MLQSGKLEISRRDKRERQAGEFSSFSREHKEDIRISAVQGFQRKVKREINEEEIQKD